MSYRNRLIITIESQEGKRERKNCQEATNQAVRLQKGGEKTERYLTGGFEEKELNTKEEKEKKVVNQINSDKQNGITANVWGGGETCTREKRKGIG